MNMKSVIKTNRSAVVASVAAALAVATMGFAGVAQARDNVYWSVGVGSPGVGVNVGNVGSVYQPQPVYVQPQPVYIQPQPVYVQPQPVYVQPAPIYYQQSPRFVSPAPVYFAPQPIYYGRRHDGWRQNGQVFQGPRNGYGPGYAPVYYQRGEGRHGHRNDD
jgi:PXPV repeat (3 copies)